MDTDQIEARRIALQHAMTMAMRDGMGVEETTDAATLFLAFLTGEPTQPEEA